MRVTYTIAAYNDMTPVQVPGRGQALLIGLMAFVPRQGPTAPGHSVVDVGYGRVEGGGWYLVRWPDGRYDLHEIRAGGTRSLVAVRTIRVSPFAGDGNAICFGGFDANKAPAHDTGWIVRAPLPAVVEGAVGGVRP